MFESDPALEHKKSDDLTRCNEAYLWSLKYSPSQGKGYATGENFDLRQWGYVFWDHARLSRMGILEKLRQPIEWIHDGGWDQPIEWAHYDEWDGLDRRGREPSAEEILERMGLDMFARKRMRRQRAHEARLGTADPACLESCFRWFDPLTMVDKAEDDHAPEM